MLVRRASSVIALSLSLAPLAAAQYPVRVSTSSSCGQANLQSELGDLSADGRFVAFTSDASSLVPNDFNGVSDVFVKDLGNDTLERVSVTTAGGEASGASSDARISADGRFVVFQTTSALDASDTNGVQDVYVRDRQLGTTTRASLGAGGAQINVSSGFAAISGDGRYVTFLTAAQLLPGDNNIVDDIYVRELATGALARCSVSTSGVQGSFVSFTSDLSHDGRFVAFQSFASNLVPNDTNAAPDIFVHDRDVDANGVFDEGNGVTTLVSVGLTGFPANGSANAPSISADGRFVVFDDTGSNLVVGDTNNAPDVFVRDLTLGTTTRVSLTSGGAQANDDSRSGSISADGRHVAFISAAALVASDTNTQYDLYLLDRQAGTLTLASLRCTGGLLGAGAPDGRLSDDGHHAIFVTPDNLVVRSDTNSSDDVFAVRVDLSPAGTVSSCAGDGTSGPCPCGNTGAPGRGCATAQSAGAQIFAEGTTSPDTLRLYTQGMPLGSLSILLQADGLSAPAPFGDGLRCFAGRLSRLGRVSAFQGSSDFPMCGGDSISTRSALVGDPLTPGSVRHYLMYFRDASPTFCPAPTGATFNATQMLSIAW